MVLITALGYMEGDPKGRFTGANHRAGLLGPPWPHRDFNMTYTGPYWAILVMRLADECNGLIYVPVELLKDRLLCLVTDIAVRSDGVLDRPSFDAGV